MFVPASALVAAPFALGEVVDLASAPWKTSSVGDHCVWASRLDCQPESANQYLLGLGLKLFMCWLLLLILSVLLDEIVKAYVRH